MVVLTALRGAVLMAVWSVGEMVDLKDYMMDVRMAVLLVDLRVEWMGLWMEM